MKCVLKCLLVVGGLWAASVPAQDVVINEIMYLPSSGLSSEEYIELYNRGATPVSLQGWQLTRGVRFTITNEITLGAGAYLVIAADRAVFQAKYAAVANVLGDWSGSLANGGETIELSDSAGNEIDQIRYADEGDWGTRRRGPFVNGHRGWEWLALHDGGGRSLELIHPGFPRNTGQNWASSAVNQGTPGMVNSVHSDESAPIISDVRHTPAIPRSSDPVTISCHIHDELLIITTITLRYRNATTLNPGPFLSTLMFDDGMHDDAFANDGVYGAILPAQPNGTVIEFYIEASDGDNDRTWPAAALDENQQFVQLANCHYQVDESVYAGNQSILRLVMIESERNELASGTIRQTDAQMNATLISVDGVDTQIRYLNGVRIRGAGSRQAQVPNFRLNIPSDNTWNGAEAVNLNSQYPHMQVVGAALAIKVGLPAADARAVQVRVNGANLAVTGSPQFGSYALVEPMGGDWAGTQFPNDGDGNVYRGSTGNHSATLSFLNSTNPVVYQGQGYAKVSNEVENDWSDLIRLTFVLSTNSDDATYVQDLEAIANVPLWMRYFAFFTTIASGETSLATGRGDDWAAYRGVEDPRFILIPHDLDSILGQGDSAGFTTDIWRMVPNFNGGANTVVLNRFMVHPAFVHYYYGALYGFGQTAFAPESIGPLVDRLLADWVPNQVLTAIKQFSVDRNNYLLTRIPLVYSASTGLPLVSGYPRSTASTFNMNGTANAVETRRVLVDGESATYTPMSGAWNITGVALRPGLNEVSVQFLGDQDREVQRLIVQVWYDDGSVATVSGILPATTTWSAAGGPYRVTADVTVPAGGLLQINSGTTIYFNAGTRLIVNGQLQADGSPSRHIRFAREPGTVNVWNGISIQNSTQSNRISYADFEFADGADPISVVNSALTIDHVTWTGTTRTIIDTSNASLIVRNSVFPTIVDNETIHGTGMPANGYVIIEGNYFGGTTGYSDIIDFTGGRRPGPILQVYDNIFNGGSDDALDLDSTDAHIEGNVFMNIHQDAVRDSGSYAIATDDLADLTVVRNLFFNNDHALLLKNGARATFHNNTVYVTRTNTVSAYPAAVISFGEPDRNVGGGAGADLDGNIFWGIDQDRHFLFFTNGVMTLNVNQSILSGTNHPGLGNLNLDPRFRISDTNLITANSIRSDLALQSGSPARATGPNGLDMGGLVPRGASIDGEPDTPTAATAATLTVGGPGITHYRFSLDQAPYGAETSLVTAIELTGLGEGSHQVSVIGKNSAGVWQDTNAATLSRSWTVQSGVRRVVLNELLARNDFGVVHEDTYPDIVELYNAGGAPVDLGGVGLTDDPLDAYQFAFAPGTMLEAGEYLVVYADEEETSGIHLGFGLNQDGDSLYLVESPGLGGLILDHVTFGIQTADLSIGRGPEGGWQLNELTFGAPNRAHATGNPALLKINEWGANGQSAFQDDFVELYNPETAPVALGGLYLTDNLRGWPDRHQMSDLSFIAAKGHLALIADGDAGGGANHLDFQLNSQQGEIGLYDAGLNLIDCVLYKAQSTDVSEGRRPSGAATISYFGPSTGTQPTPGAPNPGMGGGGGTVTNIVIDLLPVDSFWRFERNGFDLGTSWHDPLFDDSFWEFGLALLGVENSGLPFPGLNTFFPSFNNSQITYYFRTTFSVVDDLTGFNLEVATILDDGGVLYLDGAEVLRVRMPPGQITSQTQALGPSVNNATLEGWTLPGNISLSVGDHVLAMEVHQASIPSSDIVWGMSLQASKFITNNPTGTIAVNEVMARNLNIQTPGDTNITDWAEFYNPSTESFDLSGMSLSDDFDEPQRWIIPDGVIVPAGEYLVIRFDSDSPASTNAIAPLNAGFGLGSGGDRVLLFDRPIDGGDLIDSIAFGLQAADFTVGAFPDGSEAWTLTLPTPGSLNLRATTGPVSTLKFNEWLANPSGDDVDYFEIYNPAPQPVELTGLYLTDDLTDRTQYRIPNLSYVGVGLEGFALFFADDDANEGPDHVNFGLRAAGDNLALFRANGSLIDGLSFGAQENGVSEGRFPDGANTLERFPGTLTPGASNIRPIENLAVSEVLAHSDDPLEDAMEIQNVSQAYVDISNWYLSDSVDNPKRYRIPDGTVLGPGQFVVFYEYQFNPDFGVPPSFSLSSARGDEVVLSSANSAGNLTGFRLTEDFGPSENGVSFGRYQTSVDFDFTPAVSRTFGVDSPPFTLEMFRMGAGLSNAPPKVGPIILNEIHYHPPNIDVTNDNVVLEFIEIHNASGGTVPLYDPAHPENTWRLDDAVDFDFPQGFSLAAGAYVLIVSFDPTTNDTALAEFQTAFGLGPEVMILGPYDGKLDNSSDDVELEKPDEPQPPESGDPGLVPYVRVDRVRYSDSKPWATFADGTGTSLQRTSPTAYGNDPLHWVAANPTPGRANGAPAGSVPSITSQPASRTVASGATAFFAVSATGVGLGYQWTFDGKEIRGATNSLYSINPALIGHAGRYRVLVFNAFGSTLSATAQLVVEARPTIVKQPESRTVAEGTTVVFTVGANGSQPLSFQWRKGGIQLGGENDPTLRLPNVGNLDQGAYDVIVANNFGSVTSQVATLEINQLPTITSHPVGLSVYVGETATFTVQAIGTPPLRYQWRQGNAVLPGATDSTLVINNAQLSNAGNYTVLVMNSVGTVVSDIAPLTVKVRPSLSLVTWNDPVAESAGSIALFELRRAGDPDVALMVSFTLGGTATGMDYLAPASPFMLEAGVTSAPVVFTINNDLLPEREETVIMTLQSGPVYLLGNPTTATARILDDDNRPPNIEIVSPAADTIFTTPAIVPISVLVSDPDGSITLVEYFVDLTNKVGQSSMFPYDVVWTNGAAGAHELTALATDELGAATRSDPVAILINQAPTVSITSPLSGSFFQEPANIPIRAMATDLDGGIEQVEFLEGNNVLSVDMEAPFEFDWMDVVTGLYTLQARATDDRGAVVVSRPVTVSVGVQLPVFADDFENRGLILGFTNTVTGSNINYTLEADEPDHGDVFGPHTAWISWVSPSTGPCTMDTIGSDFDTVLAVYQGDQMATLVEIAASDDEPGLGLQSRVTFNAVVGMIYQVVVTGYGAGTFGAITFHQGMPNPAPVISTHPQGLTVNQGGSASFTVVAMGGPPLTYQWRHNGNAINGANGSTLNLVGVTSANAGVYTVDVANPGGSVTSLPAMLVVRISPTFTAHPQGQTVNPGDSIMLSATVAGTAPFTYQWRFNGASIPQATNLNFVLSSAAHTNGGFYNLSVLNTAGSANSQFAEVIVRPLILDSRLLEDGRFQFEFLGTPGRNYHVLSSSNLNQWSQLVTLPGAVNPATYTGAGPGADPTATRYYRLQLAP